MTLGGEALAGDLHPLLRRLYAARGVRLASDLDLGLNQLLPVGHLDGITAAVELLCAHFAKRQRHRRDRRLRCGRRDQHRAGRATAAAPRVSIDRLSRAEPLPVRLRPHARDRAARGATPAGADHHRRQRRVQSRRRRRGARARHRHVDHRSSSGAADAAGRDCARQSECAGQFVPEQGARRRRRRVLSDGCADPRDADARPAYGRRARCRSARSRRARHGRRSRAARSQQSRARSSGTAAHSRRPLLRGRARSARSREPRAGEPCWQPISAFRSARG